MEAVGAFGAAIAILLLPGGVLAAALRVAGLWWLAAAPILSIGVVGVAGVIGGFTGIPFSPWLVLGVTAVAVLAAIALRVLRRGLRPLGVWDRTAAWVVAAIAVSVTAIGLLAFGGLDLARSLSQTYDGVFHLNAVAYLLDTGNASSFDLYKMTQQGDGNEFYPAAWHSLVALVVQLTGSSILTATNVMWIVTSGLVWVPGVVAFTTTVLRGRGDARLTGVASALLASCSATFPFLLLSWGTLYPTGLAYAAMPFGLALAVAIVRRGESAVLTPWMLGVAWALAVSFAHPRSLFTVIAVVAPLLLFAGGALVRRLWSRPELRRRVGFVLGAVAALVLAVVAVGWWYVYRTFDVANRPIADHLNGGPATARQGLLDGVWQVLAQAPLLAPAEQPSFPAIALAVAVLAGLVLVIRIPQLRWLAASFVVVTALYVLAAGSNSDIAKLATGIWYKDKFRLLAAVAMVAIPLATLAIVALSGWLGRHRARVAVPVTAAVLVVTVGTGWATIALGGARASIDQVFTVRDDKAGALLDTDLLTLLERVDELVPADALIVGNPWNGSGLTWAIADRQAMFPHFVGEWTADELTIAQRLDAASSDPTVCEAVQRTGVQYLLDDPEYLWGTPPPEAGQYDGLTRAVDAGVLDPVESVGAATLYRLTACG